MVMRRRAWILLPLAVCALLSVRGEALETNPKLIGYHQKWLQTAKPDTDGPPLDPVPLSGDDIPDMPITPQPQSKTGNNAQYMILGNNFYLQPQPAGFVEVGNASWYGRKFHGKQTASGEIFDMYLPMAAHPSLPIPCYAEILSLKTGKKIIVKINDRGPFLVHRERIIDLSYGAALKLGIAYDGSTPVQLTLIQPALDPYNIVRSNNPTLMWQQGKSAKQMYAQNPPRDKKVTITASMPTVSSRQELSFLD